MTDEYGSNRMRYDWEQIIRRARCGGLIPAQGKRGAVSATTFKAVAWAWASYANPGGTRIFPGVATVAVAAEVSLKTAKLVTAKLGALGLLVRVAASARKYQQFDEYRLAIPEDLLDVLDVLTPDQMSRAADAMREDYRGKPKAEPVGGPPDPTALGDTDSVEGPLDPSPISVGGPADPAPVAPDGVGVGSGGPAEMAGVGSGGPAVGGPPDCGIYPWTVPCSSTQPSPMVDLDLNVTDPRASPDADEEWAHGLRSRYQHTFVESAYDPSTCRCGTPRANRYHSANGFAA